MVAAFKRVICELLHFILNSKVSMAGLVAAGITFVGCSGPCSNSVVLQYSEQHSVLNLPCTPESISQGASRADCRMLYTLAAVSFSSAFQAAEGFGQEK